MPFFPEETTDGAISAFIERNAVFQQINIESGT
jgi:hypothetical protein